MARASQLDSSDILTAQGKPTLHVELSQRSGADYFSNVVCFNLCEETDDPMSRGRTYAKNLRILRRKYLRYAVC